MTRPEFIRGWLLLTAQPWGKRYQGDYGTSPEPGPAAIQAELYFKALNFAYAPAWIEVCELFAGGDHWPSISQMKEALRHAKAQRPAVAQQEPDGIYLTKEQFGLDLYEAIACVGRLLAIQDHLNVAVHRQEDTGTLVKQRDEVKKRLIALMPNLDPADSGEIARRYPFVAHL
jgi:hypothetical protein